MLANFQVFSYMRKLVDIIITGMLTLFDTSLNLLLRSETTADIRENII